MDSNEKTLDNSLESTINMSQDEIEKLLMQHAEQGNAEEVDIDEDLESLLAGLESQDDFNIQDISDMLTKAEQNEAVNDEVLALLKRQEEDSQTAYDAMDLFSGEVENKKEGFFQRLLSKFKKNKEQKPISEKKEKTKKKDKKKKEKEEKLQDWEQIEVSDDFVDNKNTESMGDALTMLLGDAGDENASPIPEVKVKDKKKKNKKAGKQSEEEEIKEKSKKDKKKGKDSKDKKKENKSKKDSKETREKIKEKPTIQDAIMELEEELEEPPHKKKVIMCFLASILIMFGFLVVNFYFTGYANKHLAEEAYEEQDYLECYQLLYGQKMNDSQKAMYKRSECILKTEIFWRDYNIYVKEEKWLEGLDELTQYVHQYPKSLEDAKEWNGQELVENTYQQVQSILSEEYETEVQELARIAALESDADYTRELLKIVKEKEKREALNEKYPDMLPEEKDKLSQ